MRRKWSKNPSPIALALVVLLLAGAGEVAARGLLGLFSESDDNNRIEPSATEPEPVIVQVTQSRPEFAAFVANLQQFNDPAVELYSYVKRGQQIALGQDGEITLTFFNPCHEEVAIGGVIEVTDSTIHGHDSRLEGQAASCRPIHQLMPNSPLYPPDDSDPNPLFDATEWQEIILSGSQPIFKWPGPMEGEIALVQLLDFDQEQPTLIWEIETPFASAIYPSDAHRLIDGHPYRAIVRLPGRPVLTETFSIDRRIAFTNTPVNSVVMIKQHLEESAP